MAKKAGKKKATTKATKKKAAKAKKATTKPKGKKATKKAKAAKKPKRGTGRLFVNAADTVIPGPWDIEKMLAHALQLLTNQGIAPDERQDCINRLFNEGGAEEWWNKVAPKHLKK